MRAKFVVMALLAWRCVSGATLQGIAIANEIGGPPMPNVKVDAIGANRTETGPDGKFALDFPQRRPGDTVRLIVEREGYVVVNDVQLEAALPADGKPLIVILCRTASREEMARRFYRLKSLDAIEENYRKLLKQLETENRATAEAVAQLKSERDRAKDAAGKAAEELARQKPGQASELRQQAMRYFLDGKIDQALSTLDEDKLKGLLAAARQTQAAAAKDIEEAAQAWVLKAQLLAIQFRFDEADKNYQIALEARPNSFDVNFAYAMFSYNLNRHTQALDRYHKCLELARRSGDEERVARTLNNLGNLYTDQNRMEEAATAYEEALRLRRELAKKNRGSHMPSIVITLNNLGVLYRRQHRMDEAREALQQALKNSRELAQMNRDSYLPYVATVLTNVGSLNSEQNKRDEATEAYLEALRIYQELVQNNPDRYLPDVALLMNNLGKLFSDQHRMD